MMLSSLTYESLRDFSDLPAVRQILARGDPGFRVIGLPPVLSLNDAGWNKLEGVKIQKSELNESTLPDLRAVVALMEALHGISHVVFKNVSHGVELPWERYLGELHEFAAEGRDELRIANGREPIANEWSTLTIVINTAKPGEAFVLFGEALSVLTEGTTPVTTGDVIDTGVLAKPASYAADSTWMVYYVRPNNDVFYTRTAGALMTPLSGAEHESRQRVRDLDFRRRDAVL